MQQIYIVPPCERPVNILYQDEHLLLIDKPDLLLSIPGRHPLNQDCMITRIRVDFPSASVVHRLDLDTSGIMVVPLTKAVHSHISRQFQERRVEKSYQALVFGLVEQDSGEITLPIAPDWNDRPRQKICAERGKSALTRYEVVARDTAANCSRLLLKPVTGRSHQLRIHLAEIGHPILGCDMYAHSTALAMAPRLMLHAATLAFEHPATGAWLQGESPQQF
jgi:tRNA pseudouridine32 synthase/23S rRNA pseudouridine746 synthase